MAGKKRTALFWGHNALSVVELQGESIAKFARIPFPVQTEPKNTPANSGGLTVDESLLISSLREGLRTNGFFSPEVSLSIPSKDILIRSFIIPQLKQSEIKGVVEFEIKKHIPFNLKDLNYSYFTTPFLEETVKKMRVQFVAIRKEILQKYGSILAQSGLNVISSEPAPMSLVRALMTKKLVRNDQKVAVLQTDVNDSRIIIVDRGVVQFVRDFQLHNPNLGIGVPDPELVRKKLVNEVNISVDFYMRQFKTENVDEVITLSFDANPEITDSLQQELGLPIRLINPKSIVSVSDVSDVGIINAYGAGVYDSPNAKMIAFNFSNSGAVVSKVRLQEIIPVEYIPAVKVGFICIATIVLVTVVSQLYLANIRKIYSALLFEQDLFVEMPIEQISERAKDNTRKFQTYQVVLSKSQVANYLSHLTKILPKGIWLGDLNLRYVDVYDASGNPVDIKTLKTDEGRVKLELSGYAYLSDPNEQIKLVNSFINLLKSDKKLIKVLGDVNLTALQNEFLNDYLVTSFKVSSK